jgi:hypothetical protein
MKSKGCSSLHESQTLEGGLKKKHPGGVYRIGAYLVPTTLRTTTLDFVGQFPFVLGQINEHIPELGPVTYYLRKTPLGPAEGLLTTPRTRRKDRAGGVDHDERTRTATPPMPTAPRSPQRRDARVAAARPRARDHAPSPPDAGRSRTAPRERPACSLRNGLRLPAVD